MQCGIPSTFHPPSAFSLSGNCQTGEKKVTGVVRDAAQHHLVPLGYQQQQKSGPVIQVVSHSQAVGVFHYCQFELSAANDLFRKKNISVWPIWT